MDAFINERFTRRIREDPQPNQLEEMVARSQDTRYLAEEFLEDTLPVPMPDSASAEDVVTAILEHLILPYVL